MRKQVDRAGLPSASQGSAVLPDDEVPRMKGDLGEPAGVPPSQPGDELDVVAGRPIALEQLPQIGGDGFAPAVAAATASAYCWSMRGRWRRA